MNKNIEVEFKDIKEDLDVLDIIRSTIEKCYETEHLHNNISINIILTDNENIKELNKRYRNIEKETDVLSFPMFEKEEIKNLLRNTTYGEILGDIVISVPKVEEQAKEYEHSFKRELSYMLVHGFYHLMGYDHIDEQDKLQMREKEEYVLKLIGSIR